MKSIAMLIAILALAVGLAQGAPASEVMNCAKFRTEDTPVAEGVNVDSCV
ncbi:hypothetical protein F4678DRAFT_456569 [Xylaria arbuscula]|nr:hypothetical protein F4678DRAFT_456569 [Xylaria arbuscula]